MLFTDAETMDMLRSRQGDDGTTVVQGLLAVRMTMSGIDASHRSSCD